MLTTVYLASKLMFSCGLNRMVVRNKQAFVDLLNDKSRPLITITNHRCVVDDPLFLAMLSPREFFSNLSRFRWTLAAHNICFSQQLHASFFSLGRCVPVVRGAGVFQTGVDFCLEVLARNGWVHMFPEGKVIFDPSTADERIKWGVGRLINEAPTAPVLLPIWIKGMETVWPKSPPYYPKFGNTVELIVGEPVDTRDILKPISAKSEVERRKIITDQVQDKLFELGREIRSRKD